MLPRLRLCDFGKLQWAGAFVWGPFRFTVLPFGCDDYFCTEAWAARAAPFNAPRRPGALTQRGLNALEAEAKSPCSSNSSPSCSRAGIIGPGVAGSFSIPSSSSAALRRTAVASSDRPSAWSGPSEHFAGHDIDLGCPIVDSRCAKPIFRFGATPRPACEPLWDDRRGRIRVRLFKRFLDGRPTGRFWKLTSPGPFAAAGPASARASGCTGNANRPAAMKTT